MIPYIYASKLKKKYVVYGSFYNILITDQGTELIPCRNLLEIYDKNYFKAVSSAVNDTVGGDTHGTVLSQYA